MLDPQRHADRRPGLESLLRSLPGFKGYLQKEDRRDSDHLVRTALADRLQTGKRGLDGLLRVLVDAVRIDELPPWERVRARLDGLVSRIRGDVRGYSGLFDFVQVREDTLDAVYQHDLSLVADTDNLCDVLGQLASRAHALSEALADVQRRLDDLDRAYSRRAEILKGLEK